MTRRINKSFVTEGIIHGIFVLVSAVILLPFLLVIAISFSSEQSLTDNGYRFIPEHFSIKSYSYLLQSPGVMLQAYGVTITVTVVGTIISLLITAMTAYVLSRKDYALRRPAMLYFFLPMLFSGGLVPFYILMTQYLHLKDTLWALIVPSLLSPFFLLVLRVFLQGIPGEVIESAKIDGAREFRIFFRIVVPLSTPGLATLGLFISFSYWNEWFNAMLFINNDALVPLQLLLVRMMNTIEFLTTKKQFLQGLSGMDMANFPKLSARMAMAILVAGPMMFIFPFFQKYFVKGLTIGSLKG
ncbi:carbohydrate ABC transporter permease [Cohnella sp. GCM10027633]|uniref:carbohydrate ABC transporter permease n=1 Tax=unclassified Cohnella TaxID=2636738 RepID=UPI0036442E55